MTRSGPLCAVSIALVPLIVLVGACNKASCASCSVKINVHQADDSIRKDLFSYTPLGSKADDVLEFVLSHLHHEGLCISGVGIMPKPAIEVQLGHSFGFISHEATTAEWTFDEHLKLEGIKIRKFVKMAGGEDCDSRPRVRIALPQSDDEIRRELLKYVPLGSNMGVADNFIGMRLFFQGGPSGYGEALTGKPGVGAILGHYIDKESGVQKTVRVNFVHDKQSRIRDVEVRRVDGVAPLFPSWPKIK